jgi:hypothetical protein
VALVRRSFKGSGCDGWNVSHGTYSGDRLDFRVKVELKVLYILERMGGCPRPNGADLAG